MDYKKSLAKIPNWDTLMKWEPLVFSILLIMGLIPVLRPSYFSTLDGPEHLYNAHLILELLFGHNQDIHDIFMFNPLPVPNWSGHALMAFFLTFLPDFLAEKAFLVTYLCLTPLFFRKFILLFSPKNGVFTWFGLLIAHHNLLYFGFFNMCMGMMFLFITLYYFQKYCQSFGWKQLIILCLLLACTFFSHIMMYLITLCLLVALSCTSLVFKKTNGRLAIITKAFFTRLLLVAGAALPSLLLTANYIKVVHGSEDYSGFAPPTFNEAIRWLIDVKPLLTIRYQMPWIAYANVIFSLLALLLVISMLSYLKNFKSNFSAEKLPTNIFKATLALMTLAFLGLFFITPNAILITERLILVFYLFFILCLALQTYPKWVHLLTLLTIIVVHYQFSRHHRRTMAELSHRVDLIKETEEHIEEGSTLITFNHIDNWLLTHARGYLGSSKQIIVLQNYEASLKWFPLKWNTEKYNLEKLSDWSSDANDRTCQYYVHEPDTMVLSIQGKDGSIKPIEYAVVFGNDSNANTHSELRVKGILKASYELVFENKDSHLYKLRPTTNRN